MLQSSALYSWSFGRFDNFRKVVKSGQTYFTSFQLSLSPPSPLTTALNFTGYVFSECRVR